MPKEGSSDRSKETRVTYTRGSGLDDEDDVVTLSKSDLDEILRKHAEATEKRILAELRGGNQSSGNPVSERAICRKWRCREGTLKQHEANPLTTFEEISLKLDATVPVSVHSQ